MKNEKKRKKEKSDWVTVSIPRGEHERANQLASKKRLPRGYILLHALARGLESLENNDNLLTTEK
jgi:hypothetical protein